jgi:hypothetical protein
MDVKLGSSHYGKERGVVFKNRVQRRMSGPQKKGSNKRLEKITYFGTS